MGSWGWCLTGLHGVRRTCLGVRYRLSRRWWCGSSSCLAHIRWCVRLTCLVHHLALGILLGLQLEAFLLFFKLVEELATFPEELLRSQLSVLELLHLFLAHVTL